MKGSLKIPSDMSNLFRVENLIDDLAEQLNLGDEVYGNISVSVIEAVSNAIQHGNNNDVTKIVYFNYVITDNELSFRIEDEGKGFDLDSVPDPTLPENIESFKGRGIFLIRNLADKVIFENRGAVIVIKFKIG